MDDTAYQRVVLAHKDRVYSYAVYMLHDGDEAADVAQESLIRLWQHREKVPEEGAARAWLLKTAYHLCIDRLRIKTSRPQSPLSVIENTSANNDPGPERLSASSSLAREITGAIQELPDRDRSMVVMREIQGLPYKEIAKALEMPLGSLKASLHRAREKLRQRLVARGVTP